MKIYKHRIKDGALSRNQSLFRYTENTASIVDGEFCRIIGVIPPSINFFKANSENKNIANIYEIHVLHSKVNSTAYINPDDLIELAQEDWLYLE
tara:strand:+ start:38838 stop:39119 length:282 start_codon:yes stop_codon:yes gene_type:complete